MELNQQPNPKNPPPRTNPIHNLLQYLPGLRNRLIRLAAFQNPEFYKAQAMRLRGQRQPRRLGDACHVECDAEVAATARTPSMP